MADSLPHAGRCRAVRGSARARCWGSTAVPAAGSAPCCRDDGAVSWHAGTVRATCCALPADVVAVDVPIGLPAGPERRRADVEAKEVLGAQRSSVFFVPPRVVLEAPTQADATRLSRAAGSVGVSIQTFHILGKVAEVDALLRGRRGRPGPGGRGAPGGVVPADGRGGAAAEAPTATGGRPGCACSGPGCPGWRCPPRAPAGRSPTTASTPSRPPGRGRRWARRPGRGARRRGRRRGRADADRGVSARRGSAELRRLGAASA